MGEAPRPKSPPRHPDPCGRRRLQLEVHVLNRELGFLQQEIQGLERIQPVSRCCKDVNEFVSAKADPLVPVNIREHGSCGLYWWIRSKLCTCFSCLCCCLRKPRTPSCSSCSCACDTPCCKPSCSCLQMPSCSEPSHCSCCRPSCGHCRPRCGNCCCSSGCGCADCPRCWSCEGCGGCLGALGRCLSCRCQSSCCEGEPSCRGTGWGACCRGTPAAPPCPECSCGCSCSCPRCTGACRCPPCGSNPCCAGGCLR